MRPARSTCMSSPTRLARVSSGEAIDSAPLRRKYPTAPPACNVAAMPPRPVPLDLSAAFGRFRASDPDRLHFAAHSHHLWPDLTQEAQLQAWDDAARLVDDKWEAILSEVWRETAAGLA